MAEKSLLDIERQRLALIKQRYEKEVRNLKQRLDFFNSSAELSMIRNGNDPQVSFYCSKNRSSRKLLLCKKIVAV